MRAPRKTPTDLAPALLALAAAALVLLLSLAAAIAFAGCGTSASSVAAASPSAAALAGAAGVPEAGAVLTDLAYAGDSPSQKLDLYLPAAGEPPYPVILAIHGGGFISGDKADGQITPVLEALSRGYAVAGVNYRLSGEATFPAAISDVKAAVRWLRANAGEYQLDPLRFAAWGHSAGGNLAALAGTSGDFPALRGPHPANAGQSDRLQAVVDWYGPISFLRTDRDFRAAGFKRPSAAGPRSFLSQYLGAPLAEVPGKVKAADPITYISPDDPPVLIEHGTADGTVPYPQSRRFARAVAERAGPSRVTLRIFPGAGHVDPVFFSPEHVDSVLDWLDRQLR
jgi:acetyl esterase/lipase